MAKNTNPITKNLLIKQNWNTIALPTTGKAKHGSNELIKDSWIKSLIEGLFKKVGILTSEVSLTKNCLGSVNIQFIYYPLVKATNEESNTKLIIPIIKLIKKILIIREPTKDYKFVCIKATNKFVDGKILNNYINYLAVQDPNRLKYIVNTIIKEYKLNSTKPN